MPSEKQTKKETNQTLIFYYTPSIPRETETVHV